MPDQPVTRRLRLNRALDLPRTLGLLRRGSGDPTMRIGPDALWRAFRTPAGVATLALSVDADLLLARAWGQGAQWLLDSVPQLIGDSDDWADLDVSKSPALAAVRKQLPGLRLCRTGLVLDSLIPAILEQRVTGGEAWRAWRMLVRAYGEPAPGPSSLRLWVAPDPAQLLAVPSWDWHRYGVDAQRSRTIRAAATVASRLEDCAELSAAGDFGAAERSLRVVPGVGEWTAAETTLRALGHPDAVSVGDFHLKNRVGFALTGAARTDDETMLALLEPWRGQRARVVRLIELSGLTPPKYGPRFSPNDIRVI
ncbi:DNA-3-methyladenine glycosylase [Jatrophihabitans sp. DSM 45814]